MNRHLKRSNRLVKQRVQDSERWYGHAFEVLEDVKLNKNFIQRDLTKDILNVSSQLYAQGILSKEMILKELQRNELFLSPDDDIDEIISSHTFIDSRGLTE